MVRRFALARLLVVCGLLCATEGASIARAQDASAERKHDLGPLISAEFRMLTPDPRPMLGDLIARASTRTKVTFNYNWAARDAAGGREMTANQITVTATFIPAESWIAEPNDAALLNHEQGHFDIASRRSSARSSRSSTPKTRSTTWRRATARTSSSRPNGERSSTTNCGSWA
jgi:hypothetical protein